MKTKQKKQLQKHFAQQNLSHFINLVKNNTYPTYTPFYIREILRFSTSFNIRLKREEKLLFCKKCFVPWNIQTRTIRFDKNTKTKTIICKNCGFKRRFPY